MASYEYSVLSFQVVILKRMRKTVIVNSYRGLTLCYYMP